MATASEVKAGLDEISAIIKQSKEMLTQAKESIAERETALLALPTTFDDLITTVNGYLPDGAFETLSKDELALLTTEFVALRTSVTSAKTDLDAYTEF